MSSCNIKVVARFRPFNENEKKNQDKTGHSEFELNFTDGVRVEIKLDKQSYNFTFDIVYDTETKQSDLYDAAAKPSIDDLLEGYNSTIFAYGQTGSGKSYTMFGVRGVEDLKGIIPRASGQIFSFIENDERDIEYAIKSAFLEIYKEKIYDLLSPNPKETSLKVRESPSKGVWVDGLHEEFIGSEDDIHDLLTIGEAARTVSSTEMNARSSRSHSVFMIIVEQKLSDGSVKTGKLNLVDLAGSERVAKTNVNAKQLEEAKDINKSLSTLGKCIHALADQSTKGGKVHVPYRESSLTRILQESLGGNTKTTLIITCSPAVYNAEESLSTLRFGASAKTIKNTVSINQKRSVEELEALLKNMQKEMASLRAYTKKLEVKLGITSGHVPLSLSSSLPEPSSLMAMEKPTAIDNKRSELALNLNLSPRPGSAPARSRSASASLASPRLLMENPDGSISDVDIEDYNPLALAETKAKLEELQKTTEMQLDQLKSDLKEAQEREANQKFELEAVQDKFEKTLQKLEALREKSAQEHTDSSLKLQQLEDALQEKTEEADEAIIVLYADNERMENEVQELNHKLKQFLGGLSPVKEILANTETGPFSPHALRISTEAVDLNTRILELEESLATSTRKLRAAGDKEAQQQKKLDAQKERVVSLTNQITELSSKNAILKEETAELQHDKEILEKDLSAARAAQKEVEEKHTEQIKAMEKMIQKRARLFKPAKRRGDDAMHTKVDLAAQVQSLKKTHSNFLEMARKEHERSQMTRGEQLFGIHVNNAKNLSHQAREQYRKVFQKLDKDGSGTIDTEEMRSCLGKLGKNLPEEELQKMMKQLDKDGNGVIDFDEFLIGMTMVME